MDNKKTRAIIIAAGEATRWNKHLGVDKHFIEVNGEPIIHRTVRLLNKYGVGEIYVVGKDKRYEIEGSKLYVPKLNKDNFDADKFLSSQELWSQEERTMIIYGDCFFTEDAIRIITEYKTRGWVLFARPFFSRVTGHEAGECFVVNFYPENIYAMDFYLHKLIRFYKGGILDRIGGWELYRMHIRLPIDLVDHHLVGGMFQEINDFTEDFDTPDDYESWKLNFDKLTKKQQEAL